jgi:hypothetical protein
MSATQVHVIPLQAERFTLSESESDHPPSTIAQLAGSLEQLLDFIDAIRLNLDLVDPRCARDQCRIFREIAAANSFVEGSAECAMHLMDGRWPAGSTVLHR